MSDEKRPQREWRLYTADIIGTDVPLLMAELQAMNRQEGS